ncbi:hypothetical protein SDC9_106781 [bioreactor metagenome]|uniref:Uncharacterized protein n=1 Tax=bioreactor metagenome TaxID=1076179 RepID=A0A645B3D6_9ZZZZ
MHVFATDRHDGLRRIETFVFKFTQRTAIHRVGKVATKSSHIKKIGSAANFFIGPEGDFDVPMLYVIRCFYRFQGCDDFSDAGFVVSTQQRFSIGSDQCLTDVVLQRREVLGRKHHLRFRIQNQIVARIVFPNKRIYIRCLEISCVHMSDEPDCRELFL